MTRLLSLLILVLFCAVSHAQTWRKLAGTAAYVHRIKVFSAPDVLVACGDDAPPYNELQNSSMEFYSGLGFRTSTDDGQTWSEPKLSGYSVRDIVRLPNDPNTWIASVVRPFTNTGGILRSTDGGQTWSGVPENDLLRIEQFLSRPYDPPMILSAQVNTDAGFQVSLDSARSFSPPSLEPVQTRSIEISQADTSLVFMAGDGRGLPGVFRSRDNGRSWSKDSAGLDGKRILCVYPSRLLSNVVYCGTDSVAAGQSVGTGIFKSNDTGKSWFRLRGSEGKRVWRIIEHPLWGDVLIAAADSAGVLVSGNWGDGWERWVGGLTDTVVVRTVELVRTPLGLREIQAYIGTYGDGVYKSTAIVTGVDATVPAATVTVWPNPSMETSTVTIPFATMANLHIVRLEGGLATTVPPSAVTARSTAYTIDCSGLAAGAYVVTVTDGTLSSSTVLIVQR